MKLLGIVLAIGVAATAAPAADDPLPSWNDGPSKAAIVSFVRRVTGPGTADFVAPENRIAVFDNDGTLWSEQPVYFQAAFAADRLKALAPQHPEWKTKQPFRGVFEGDAKVVAAAGEKGLLEIVAASHAGMTTDEFASIVERWIETARHPRFKRRYDELVYQPMIELLKYLRAHGFETWIVSGGGIEFLRPWAPRLYGIAPQQIVGSSFKVKWEVRNGTPVLMRLPEINFIDDGPGKPAGIHYHIGRRPIAAFGNSDGDLQMLQWVTSGPGPRFGLIVHHTDAKREWAYDRQSHVGRLAAALDEAPRRGWTVVDMAKEWKVIYPFER
jgi:hypothetical protein